MSNTSSASPLRHVVIGVGAGIFKAHQPALSLPDVRLVAVSDINETIGRARAAELGCAFYTDARRMLAETQPDVAVILTPHPLHAELAIMCMEAGCHVLVEKPMATQVADADAMIATAERRQRRLEVVFQQRFRPEVQAAHRLIQEGRLGRILHVEMTVMWLRPNAYYQLAPWRGTWRGEGGGVLLNQAAHNLDLLCYLAGMPRRVYAWTRTLLHPIAVEDTAQAILEWPNGALGSFHVSTAESGTPDLLRIIGTKGSLELVPHRLQFTSFETDIEDYIAHETNPYAPMPEHAEPSVTGTGSEGHLPVYRSFHDAILRGGPGNADGVQGRRPLELANAMIYSSYTHAEVEFPLSREGYAELLTRLMHEESV
jgi:predicted dehydrogenase